MIAGKTLGRLAAYPDKYSWQLSCCHWMPPLASVKWENRVGSMYYCEEKSILNIKSQIEIKERRAQDEARGVH